VTERVNARAVPVLFICKVCEAGSADPTWYLKLRLAGHKEMSGVAGEAGFTVAKATAANRRIRWAHAARLCMQIMFLNRLPRSGRRPSGNLSVNQRENCTAV
jgi:hypothetical protein